MHMYIHTYLQSYKIASWGEAMTEWESAEKFRLWLQTNQIRVKNLNHLNRSPKLHYVAGWKTPIQWYSTFGLHGLWVTFSFQENKKCSNWFGVHVCCIAHERTENQGLLQERVAENYLLRNGIQKCIHQLVLDQLVREAQWPWKGPRAEREGERGACSFVDRTMNLLPATQGSSQPKLKSPNSHSLHYFLCKTEQNSERSLNWSWTICVIPLNSKWNCLHFFSHSSDDCQ